MPPSATILLKLYTIDKFYKKLTVVGFATLNVFVAVGTNRQPRVDTGGVQVSDILLILLISDVLM